MALALPVVWSDTHRLHEPGGEVFVGVRTPGTEVPARAEAIRETLAAAGAPFVEALAHPDSAVLAVHDERLVRFLSGAWTAWAEAELPADPGQDRVVPYVFPLPGVLSGRAPLEPAATWARTGLFAYDTMTLLGPGTWEAARAAVDVALTAADLVLAADLSQPRADRPTPVPTRREAGTVPGCDDPVPSSPQGMPRRSRAAYACCRPPGHHVTRGCYGGSCYLNNAAIAAQHLRDQGRPRVAVLDVDAHHGNGTQEIFWERDDVFTASVHVDPAAGWFPHFLGLAAEVGGGDGRGANLNVPVAPGTGDDGWLEAVARIVHAAAAHGADGLVVALGVDAAGGDPESPLRVTEAGFREAGRMLGALGLPTVVVQEGGYDLASIGGLVLAALTGIEEGQETSGG